MGNLREETPATDYLSLGGGGELHAGVRFLRHFGVKLFFERYWLLPASALSDPPEVLPEGTAFEVTSQPFVSGLGISAIAGSERGRIGGYGELGLTLSHQYGWNRDIVDTDRTKNPDFEPCTETQTYSGPALRVGGAFAFPVHENAQLTAVVMATLGSFRTLTQALDCVFTDVPDGQSTGPLGESAKRIQDAGFHGQLFIGVGGDFLFGEG